MPCLLVVCVGQKRLRYLLDERSAILWGSQRTKHIVLFIIFNFFLFTLFSLVASLNTAEKFSLLWIVSLMHGTVSIGGRRNNIVWMIGARVRVCISFKNPHHDRNRTTGRKLFLKIHHHDTVLQQACRFDTG